MCIILPPPKLSLEDIKTIVRNYDVGEPKDIKEVIREVEILNPCYIIDSTEGKFFLKIHEAPSYSTIKSLEFIQYLMEKGYPTVKMISTRNGNLYVPYKGALIVIFEYIDIPEKWILSKKEAYEIGKYCALLHIIGKEFPMRQKKHPSFDDLRRLFYKHIYKTKNAPKICKHY